MVLLLYPTIQDSIHTLLCITEDDGAGGLETRFGLSWPQQREAQVMQGPCKSLKLAHIVVYTS